jgi:predicted transcriptional regulator
MHDEELAETSDETFKAWITRLMKKKIVVPLEDLVAYMYKCSGHNCNFI